MSEMDETETIEVPFQEYRTEPFRRIAEGSRVKPVYKILEQFAFYFDTRVKYDPSPQVIFDIIRDRVIEIVPLLIKNRFHDTIHSLNEKYLEDHDLKDKVVQDLFTIHEEDELSISDRSKHTVASKKSKESNVFDQNEGLAILDDQDFLSAIALVTINHMVDRSNTEVWYDEDHDEFFKNQDAKVKKFIYEYLKGTRVTLIPDHQYDKFIGIYGEEFDERNKIVAEQLDEMQLVPDKTLAFNDLMTRMHEHAEFYFK